jgi:hypothetical protein
MLRCVVVSVALLIGQPAAGQVSNKLFGNNVDVRTVLTFKVEDAAAQRLVPEGWEVNAPASGPSQGSNVGIVLIDGLLQNDAEGKSVAPFRGAVFIVPGKKKASDTAGVMVWGGLVSPPPCPERTAYTCLPKAS